MGLGLRNTKIHSYKTEKHFRRTTQKTRLDLGGRRRQRVRSTSIGGYEPHCFATPPPDWAPRWKYLNLVLDLLPAASQTHNKLPRIYQLSDSPLPLCRILYLANGKRRSQALDLRRCEPEIFSETNHLQSGPMEARTRRLGRDSGSDEPSKAELRGRHLRSKTDMPLTTEHAPDTHQTAGDFRRNRNLQPGGWAASYSTATPLVSSSQKNRTRRTLVRLRRGHTYYAWRNLQHHSSTGEEGLPHSCFVLWSQDPRWRSEAVSKTRSETKIFLREKVNSSGNDWPSSCLLLFIEWKYYF